MATDPWTERLRRRPILTASVAGVLVGLVGGGLPLRIALLLSGNDHESGCDSPYPVDCMFTGAFELILLAGELIIFLLAVTLAFVLLGVVLLAVSGVRLRMSRRVAGQAKRAGMIVFASGSALLTAAAAPVIAFFV